MKRLKINDRVYNVKNSVFQEIILMSESIDSDDINAYNKFVNRLITMLDGCRNYSYDSLIDYEL